MERREKGKLAKAQRKLEAASLVNNPDSVAAVIDEIKADEGIFVEQVLGNIPDVTLTRVEVQALDKQEAIDAAERIIDEFEAVEATGRKLGEAHTAARYKIKKIDGLIVSSTSICSASARRPLLSKNRTSVLG